MKIARIPLWCLLQFFKVESPGYVTDQKSNQHVIQAWGYYTTTAIVVGRYTTVTQKGTLPFIQSLMVYFNYLSDINEPRLYAEVDVITW